MIGQFFTA